MFLFFSKKTNSRIYNFLSIGIGIGITSKMQQTENIRFKKIIYNTLKVHFRFLFGKNWQDSNQHAKFTMSTKNGSKKGCAVGILEVHFTSTMYLTAFKILYDRPTQNMLMLRICYFVNLVLSTITIKRIIKKNCVILSEDFWILVKPFSQNQSTGPIQS